MTSVVVFDYGFGNVRSMVRALANLDLDVTLTSDHRQALEADGLVVPGVGAFGACMEGLKSVGGDRVIKDRLRAGRPVLGVCVGEQIMFERGMEHGDGTPGLGLIKGDVELLDADVVPHMGWDTVEAPEGSVLLKGVENERFYFVHSFAAMSASPADTSADQLDFGDAEEHVTRIRARQSQQSQNRKFKSVIARSVERPKTVQRNERYDMSLTLLPAVDVRDGKAVRLRQGESGSETDYGSPLEAARTWVESGAEWIHLVDLDAAFGTGNNRDQLRAIVKELGDKVNIEMSGGVRDDASLDAALEAGAARVNIGTAALENPDWTASVIKKYGDRVAVGLDVRGHTLAARGWVKEGGDLFETMKFLDSVGCSRYVVTDVARDGMMSGPNIELLREVASRTDAKVTASGGISKLDDLRNIKELAELGVDAAILGKSLYARAFTLEEALEVAR